MVRVQEEEQKHPDFERGRDFCFYATYFIIFTSTLKVPKLNRDKMKSNALITLIIAVAMSSCCKIVPPSFTLAVEDPSGNSILPNESSDSTWLIQSSYNDNFYPIEIVSTSQGNALLIETDGLASEQDHLIKVNENDIDTLNVKYKLTGLFCKRNLKIKEVTYNGKNFGKEANRITKY